MKKKKKLLTLHDKDKSLIDFDKLNTPISNEEKEQFYEAMRKKIESVIGTMKHCTTKKLVTRRDFIAKGLLAGGAFALTPKISSTGTSIFSQAQAQSGSGSNFGALMLFAEGGPQLFPEIFSGKVMPMDMSSTDYSNMGIINADLPNNGNVVSSMGLKWTGRSQAIGILAGIIRGAGNSYATFKDKVSSTITHIAIEDDDTGGKVCGITQALAALMGPGLSTYAAGGAQGSPSGTGSNEIFSFPPGAPVYIPNPASGANIPGATAPGAKWQPAFSGNATTASTIIYATLQRMVDMGLASAKSVEAIKKDLIKQNASKVKTLNTTAPSWKASVLQAPDAATFQSIFNTTNYPNGTERNAMIELMHLVTNKVDGGPITSVVGGLVQGDGDYHQQGEATSRAQAYNFQLGVTIGTAFAAATARGSDLCVTVISNGSQTGGPTNPTTGWIDANRDNPNGCFVITMNLKQDASLVPALKTAGKYNIGGYSATTGPGSISIQAGPNFPFATDTKLGMTVVLANIARFWGKELNWDAVKSLGAVDISMLENFIAYKSI